MSASGHLQTWPVQDGMSASPLKADIRASREPVRGQNQTFVAGTSNARHAERLNDRGPVLPHRPRLSRSTASAGSPTMIS